MKLNIQEATFSNNGTAQLALTGGNGRIVATLAVIDQKLVEELRSRNAVDVEIKFGPFKTIAEVGTTQV